MLQILLQMLYLIFVANVTNFDCRAVPGRMTRRSKTIAPSESKKIAAHRLYFDFMSVTPFTQFLDPLLQTVS